VFNFLACSPRLGGVAPRGGDRFGEVLGGGLSGRLCSCAADDGAGNRDDPELPPSRSLKQRVRETIDNVAWELSPIHGSFDVAAGGSERLNGLLLGKASTGEQLSLMTEALVH
jgi:hypothetical protein